MHYYLTRIASFQQVNHLYARIDPFPSFHAKMEAMLTRFIQGTLQDLNRQTAPCFLVILTHPQYETEILNRLTPLLKIPFIVLARRCVPLPTDYLKVDKKLPAYVISMVAAGRHFADYLKTKVPYGEVFTSSALDADDRLAPEHTQAITERTCASIAGKFISFPNGLVYDEARKEYHHQYFPKNVHRAYVEFGGNDIRTSFYYNHTTTPDRLLLQFEEPKDLWCTVVHGMNLHTNLHYALKMKEPSKPLENTYWSEVLV